MIHEKLYSIPSTAFIAAAVVAWYIVLNLQYRARHAKLGTRPPLVPYYLPFGIDSLWKGVKHQLNHNNFGMLSENVRKYGPTFMVRIPGEEILVTVDPENIKAILAIQFQDFGKGMEFHNMFEFFLGDGIFNVDGHQWSEARALLRPQFHKQRISDLHVFEDHISKMISLLPKDGRTVNLFEWWLRFTLDASTDYLLGESVESLTNPKTFFAEAFAQIQETQGLRARMGPLWRIWYPKKFTNAMKVLNDFLEPYIERAISQSREDIERKEQIGEKVNFIDSLSQFTRDRTVLRDQLVSTLLAGRDTTACTLSWLFYELSHHPHIYQTLRAEVLKTLGTDGKPTYDDLKSMKYMQWCLNEVLRLYPIVPFNVRTALVDTTLPHGGGPTGLDPIVVPKGTSCGYSALVMQRRQDLFGSTVDEFNPSRWATWTPVAWTYIPFNGGPRICLGQNFALTEMAYATARMCQVFTGIESRALEERGTGVFKADIVLSPLFGVKVGLLVGKTG